MSNRLALESSPYLLQHKDNPVDWYPWGQEAFSRAGKEDKPIFLSIGYSTCHWCHVMAHESFEDESIAELLNKHFICIKVDKEERPDIDSIYMAVCQSFTGSGGWPMSIFMTAEQKPFFAGTYFPPDGYAGRPGFRQLLLAVHEAWQKERDELLHHAEQIIAQLGSSKDNKEQTDPRLSDMAVALYAHSYDRINGGFGSAPKFPAPHNLLFLLRYYEQFGNKSCLKMVEHSLRQMYRGGLFDHIGYGFCRYSTDERFLVPHFEKMLYDNALLILACCRTCRSSADHKHFQEIAEKTAEFVLREMTSPEGAFYSALDADSEGEEGKYYLFSEDEIINLLGSQDAQVVNRSLDITKNGNFEGKNIPNLLQHDLSDRDYEKFLPLLRQYRSKRYSLHLDDKVLTSWNALMIAALCELYRVSGKKCYLQAAQKADDFLHQYLYPNGKLFASRRGDRLGAGGFLDDYAAWAFAQLSLYDASWDHKYLQHAQQLCNAVKEKFAAENGGFYLYANDSEKLILRPRETYDGAIPSGNSLMAYVLVRLSHLSDEEEYSNAAKQQLDFMAADATAYPPGYAMYLWALMEYYYPPAHLRVVADGDVNMDALRAEVGAKMNLSADVVISQPSEQFPLQNATTTFYVCRDQQCLPPVNDLSAVVNNDK